MPLQRVRHNYFRHRDLTVRLRLLKQEYYLGAAKSMASRRRFSSLSFGYRADSAFARRTKSGPRSISDFTIVRSAFALPDFCSSIAIWTWSSVVVPCLGAGASSRADPALRAFGLIFGGRSSTSL